MSDTIQVTYKVMEDGSLKAIGRDAEKAAKGTDKATKSADKYSKKQKGVAGISSNSTKNFSKMTTGITDGLVPAYATLAANVFALTALFGVLSRNDAIAKLQEGLEFTGRAGGRNLTLVADKLKEITDNAISAEQAMRTTAIGVSAGFTQDQMEGLARVAKGAAMALGRDLGDAMDRLTRGAAKLEPEILDELGIMVRLDDAVRDYAIAHNKATTELTQFERRMAFTNAIINDGVSKYQALSDALNPSAYSQLSATFSDLTKTFVNGINSFFGPVLKFFSQTPIAVGALAAAFGAALSGQIMGGLKGMAEGSLEASKATKDMVGESLKGVSAHEKLGKAFNEVANGSKREKQELDRMMKSLNMTINMTSKDTEKLRIAKRVRNQLTKEIHLQNIAESKKTHGTALATMQTHGLSAAAKVQAQAFRELALAHTTATATTTGFSTAGVFARTVTTGLAMSVRFLGAAFLTIMPYIAGIMMAFSLLSPLFKKFFKDTSNLAKATQDNAIRFKEFMPVAEQYVKTIPHAKDATEAWLTTLKPVSGLLTEISSSLSTAYTAADTDRVIKLAKATEGLGNAEAYLSNSSSNAQFLAGSRALKLASKNQEEAAELSEKALKVLQDTAVEASTKITLAFNRMAKGIDNSTEEGAIALKVLQSAQEKVDTAFNTFAASDRGEEAYKALQKQINLASESANSAVNSFTTFNESIKQIKELIGDPTKTFGPFSDHIDKATAAINKIQNVGKEGGPTEEMAKKILKAFGFEEGSLEDLEGFKKKVVELNDSMLENQKALSALNIEKSAGTLSSLDLLQKELDLQTKITTNANIAIGLAVAEKKHEAQITFNNELAKELAMFTKLYELHGKNAESSGMGKGTAAIIAGEGRIRAAKDEDKDSVRSDVAKSALSGIAADMKALGPEGELMASTIQGALNMEQAFTTAFAVIDDKSNSMTSRIAAGIGAASAAIGAFAAASAAKSDQVIAGLDREIAAEKKRDGVTIGSQQKIAKLEAKKEAAKKKAFDTDKKMKIAQTIMATASGIMQAFQMGPILGPIFGAMVAATGAMQLGVIKSMKYDGGGSAPSGPSKMTVGERNNTVDLASGKNPMGELAYIRGESGVGTGASNYKPAFSGYKHRAGGGYIVGEQGPEVFMPETSGNILPSGQNETAPVNVNFTIQAIDTQNMQDALAVQRNNIIGMIREAAHSTGDGFLEAVDINESI